MVQVAHCVAESALWRENSVGAHFRSDFPEVERLQAREVAPVIVSLQEQLEQVRRTELERMRGRFGQLTPQQEEALEALTRGIMNKIAHGPIAELRKNAGQPHGLHLVDTIRRVFRLQ